MILKITHLFGPFCTTCRLIIVISYNVNCYCLTKNRASVHIRYVGFSLLEERHWLTVLLSPFHDISLMVKENIVGEGNLIGNEAILLAIINQ